MNNNIQDVDYTAGKQWDGDDTNYYDIDLSTARTKPEAIELAGRNIFVSLEAWDDEKTISSTLETGKAVITVNEKSGAPKELSGGMSYKFGAAFDKIWITNAAQSGKMLRIVSGVETEVAPYSSLLALDPDARFNFTGDELEVINPTLNAILGGTAASKGYVDLTGCTYVERTSTGTTNVVTAVANTNGIRIACADVVTQANSLRMAIEVDGNNFLDSDTGYGGNNPIVLSKENYIIPAGLALDIVSSAGATGIASIWYEVL